MRDDELILLADLNFAEANRDLARRAGGVAHDEDGLCFWVGGYPLPVLANGVMRTRTALSGEETLARTEAFFAQYRRGYTVVIREHADRDLERAARLRKLQAWGSSPAMVLSACLPDARPPAGIRLDRVASEGDAAAFAEVMGAAYATYGMPSDMAPAVLTLDVLEAPHIASFVARLEDGTPAAGAMVLVSHGVAGVYWVGTIPAARGRGLGELCTRAAGNAGFDLGARMASLQASVMGEPVYRKMGYVTVTRYLNLVWFG